MHEAGAFARHGVLVAAGDVEHAVGDAAQIRRPRHEAVIAVDHDHRAAAVALCEVAPIQGEAGIEEHLADEDEVEALLRNRVEAVLEGFERLGRHARDGDETLFLQARDLSREGMKLAVGGQDADRSIRREA
jgi:hypothetical protein